MKPSEFKRSTGVTPVIVLLSLAACVHADVQRVGRQRLGDGHEGYAPIVAALPEGHEEVAIIRVAADPTVADDARRLRHLQRRASLLGCDGLTEIHAQAEQMSGTCVRRRDPSRTALIIPVRVATPSADLLGRAEAAGPAGYALVQVLRQVRNLPAQERIWPIRWYLDTYPDSPFRADVEALLGEGAPTVAMAGRPGIRSAPLSK